VEGLEAVEKTLLPRMQSREQVVVVQAAAVVELLLEFLTLTAELLVELLALAVRVLLRRQETLVEQQM
jgi:hypothetical protein